MLISNLQHFEFNNVKKLQTCKKTWLDCAILQNLLHVVVNPVFWIGNPAVLNIGF